MKPAEIKGVLDQVEKELKGEKLRAEEIAFFRDAADIYRAMKQHVNGTRPIGVDELCSLRAIISYRAHQSKCSEFSISLAVQDAFRVGAIEDIRARDFPQTLAFLIDWRGLN